MRLFSGSALMIIAPGLICLTFPETVDACIDQSTGSAVLKVLTAVLVGGLFAYNHFKSRINNLVKQLFTKGKKHD